MNTDATGRFSAMYKPFHLIGLELNISILSAALLNQPTVSTQAFNADVVATAKRDLSAGESLDGEGGFTVYGTLLPAQTSLAERGLPIGLAHGVTLKKPVAAGQRISWEDLVEIPKTEAVEVRQMMEQSVPALAAE